MPKVLPIDLITFAPTDAASLSTKIAPPYDVLDEGPKQELLAKDPHNIVEIDLPVTPPKTVGPDEAYQQAAQTLALWLEQGVMIQRDQPAIVAYEQQFELAGQTFARRGLFAGIGLEEFNQPGGIFRHEMTIPGGVNDRYKLTEASKTQMSPVFSVFDDAQGEIVELLSKWFDNSEPDFQATTTHDNVTHRCWIVDTPDTLAGIEQWFTGKPIYIADGHHRYTTALKLSQDHPDLPSAGKCLMVLVAAQDPGMIVRATHRVVTGLGSLGMEQLRRELTEIVGPVEIESTSHTLDEVGLKALSEELPRHDHHAMGLIEPSEGRAYILRFTDADPLAKRFSDKPAVWRKLDVAILQHGIVEGVLAPKFAQGVELGEAASDQPLKVLYTADASEAASMTQAQPGRLGIIMQSTPLESVMAVAQADEVMPPKSTFFYPKLASGLVLHPVG